MRRLLVAATVSAAVVMTGCDPSTTSAQPTPSPEPTATAIPPAVEKLVEPTGVDSAGGVSSTSPAAILQSATAATAAVTGGLIRYATNGFPSLTATSWSADVTVSPPTAKGSGALLVDGERKPTDFTVSGGRLTIENMDGTTTEVGPSRGVLDPPQLLDTGVGMAALIAAVSNPEPDTAPSDIDGTPMVRLRAKLPAAAAGTFLPTGALPAGETLTVTLWFDPSRGDVLRQMLLVSSAGSATIQLLPTAGITRN